MTIAADLSNFAFSAAGVNTGGFTSRNKIINGAMVIDQRNSGSSVTSTNDSYTVDRWAAGYGSPVNAFTIQQSSTVPAGFKNSMLITAGTGASASSAGYAYLRQPIEGFNTADLSWGTASASPITISFWVRSSLTGSFGIVVRNSAGDRAYGATFTIYAANTFEYKTITISGDTSGTWLTSNGIGLHLFFDLGVGSNYNVTAGSWQSFSNAIGVTGTTKLTATTGATLYITGVQLEKGTSATPFEYRNYQQELAMCQRYCYVLTRTTTQASGGNLDTFGGVGNCWSTVGQFYIQHPVKMRTAPSTTFSTASTFGMHCPGASDQTLTAISLWTASVDGMIIRGDFASSLGSWPPGILVVRSSAASATITTSAEL